MEIIDGYKGTPHITPNKIGVCQKGIIGQDSYVLNVGNKLGYQIVSGNKIRILDGAFVVQGRRGQIAPGSYDEVTIANGSQGAQRKDIIVIEYTKNTSSGVEDFALKVVKGTSSSSSPELPTLSTSDINAGATIHQEALYIVTVTDASISVSDMQIDVIESMWDMIETSEAVEEKKTGWIKKAGEKIFAYAHAKTVMWSGTTSLYTKLTEIIKSIPAAVAVKGDAESSYRTGNVNLTPKNIGASPSNHNHDNVYYTKTKLDKYMESSTVGLDTDPASFNMTSNSSYISKNVVSINMYVKSGSNVMANNNQLSIGTLSRSPKQEMLVPIFDVGAGKLLLGRIKENGDVAVNAQSLEGERYLMINATFCI